ncbi:LysR family transcriptional regulator [Sphingomonas sp. AOB5]|uniref:LysR family transcriptional regulator n=1 Tax=Sphingomonas sp. AOB5 TaxID=3034017 RepID=UPI0023F76BFB|nr:LysR family transcriptional regulator [Sphingomonas sp. AOB5]MDF7776440.1 LysR family transcriptional regulator [Sphingomonas sp. AOB5]
MSHIHGSPLSKLDLGMIVALEIMLRERSVSKAARSVGLSQPAMSNALARMRDIFGDALLVRSEGGMVLTERGERLLHQLAPLVAELETLADPSSFDAAESTATFRLAATDHAGATVMPDVFRAVAAEAPGVKLHALTMPSREIDLHDAEAGQVDLRLGWIRALPANWYSRTLFDEELVLIGARDNPALAAPLDMEQFLALPHIALATDRPMFQNLTDQALAAAGHSRNIVGMVSHFAMAPFIVARSGNVAMFPKRLAEFYRPWAELKIVDSPFAFEHFSVSIAWHPRVHNDPGHKWLRALIVRCATAG